jgi:hypothetical protein
VSESLWGSVDALTHASRLRVERDDGTVCWVEVPSLWRQAVLALYSPGEPGNGGAGVVARERSVMDLDLLEVCTLIRRTVWAELRTRGEVPPITVPAALRRLASLVTAPGSDLDWWEYRFSSWARLLAAHLQTGERQPSAVHLRGASCPECDTSRVLVESSDGPVFEPALVIDFAHGIVQAARCGSCSATWWRGAELERLAGLLG